MTQNPSGTSRAPTTSTPVEIDFSPLTERDAALPRGGGADRVTRFRAYQRKLAAAENGRPGKTDAEWIAEAAGSPHAREMLARHQASENGARKGLSKHEG